MPQTSNRPGGADPRPIIQNHAGGEISVSPNLPHRPDNRAALRSLLARVDLAEPMRRRSVVEAIKDALPETWLRRARDFDAVYPGCEPLALDAPLSQVESAPSAAQTALACRRHARLLAEAEAGECRE
jgi:hypothetical protein